MTRSFFFPLGGRTPVPLATLAREIKRMAPVAELQPLELTVPCALCRERWARGELALPRHPACEAHLRSGR